MFSIEVKYTDNLGNGVFATKDFSVGEVIEVCPAVSTPSEIIDRRKDGGALDFLEYWFFEWNEDKKGDAMILGYGMIYNHSDEPNATYESDFMRKTVTFKAIKPIPRGSQIFINYQIADEESIEMLTPDTHEEIEVRFSK